MKARLWLGTKASWLITGGILVVVLVLIIIALWNREEKLVPLSSALATATILPSTPIVTPTVETEPPVSVIPFVPDVLFESLKQQTENEMNVSVTEGDNQWMYAKDKTMFFSGDSIKIDFSYQAVPAYSVKELAGFTGKISVRAVKDGKDIPYTMKAFEKESTGLAFYLENLPKADISIQFTHADGQQTKEFVFIYSIPFTYDIQSKSDAEVARYFDMPGFARRVLPGQTYEYELAFSLDVERSVVEERLQQQLEGFDWSVVWQDDRHLTVLVPTRSEHIYKRFTLNMNRIISKSGYELLQWSHMLLVIVSDSKVYEEFNFVSEQTTPLFQSMVSYSSLRYSPDGKWILAMERTDEIDYRLSILDRQGNVKRYLEPSLGSGQWLSEGHSIVYIYDKQLLQYDLDKDTSQVLWSLPPRKAEHKDSFEKLVEMSLDPKSGKIVLHGSYNDTGVMDVIEVDLYLFDDIHDSQPRSLKNMYRANFKYGYCSCGVTFTDSQHFFYNSSEIVERDGEQQTQDQLLLMDWSTLESKPLWKGVEEIMYWAYLADDQLFVYANHSDPFGAQWYTYDIKKNKSTELLVSGSTIEYPHSIGRRSYLMFSQMLGWSVLDLVRKENIMKDNLSRELKLMGTLTDKAIFLKNPDKPSGG